MNTPHSNENVAALRSMSAGQLEKLGQQSLRDHLVAQALVVHQRYQPLEFASLERLLQDPDCVRFPTRMAFEFGDMAQHQFAQPAPDWRNSEHDGRILYLRPALRSHPDLAVLATLFMIPVVNYGDVVTDDHCLDYGATALGLLRAEYYAQLCRLADLAGATTRRASA